MKKVISFIVTSLSLIITSSVYGQGAVSGNSSQEKLSLIQLVPIVISSLALLFSIISLAFNYYIQYHKPARISIVVSDKLKAWLGDGKFVCIATVTFFNKGARYGAVYKMNAILLHKSTKTTTKLTWRMFVQDKNIGKDGEEFKTHSSFESWADTILIQGRTAVSKRVQFFSGQPFELKEGEYGITFFIYTGVKKTHSFSQSKTFTVTKKDLEKWSDVINGYNLDKRIATKSHHFALS